ncbi:hypothetical protein Scep_009405 [Stephania cephalantha]|uniref:Uncharacterized protein n=1 Tax=Stephania cephalantha TaxID=152367 RepID=A0AAP0JTS7_9MAGN
MHSSRDSPKRPLSLMSSLISSPWVYDCWGWSIIKDSCGQTPCLVIKLKPLYNCKNLPFFILIFVS